MRSSGEIAAILRAPRSKVSAWLANFEREGIDALKEGVRSGRPAMLTEKQISALDEIVDSGPVAYGFDCGVWTSPMIARVIEDEFGVTYHPGHVRKMLHGMGFSVQRPRKTLARADAEAQDRWHRKTYPGVKKKSEKKAAHSSLRTRPRSAKTRRSTPPGPGLPGPRSSR
jgi:transposase